MRRAFAVIVAAVVAVMVVSAAPADRSAGREASRALAHPLPEPGALARRATQWGRGPRVIAGVPLAGRRIDLWGAAGVGRSVLVAGCVNGDRCAGEDVVRAAAIGCPPDDADLWLFETLRPGGADLDLEQDARGAVAWRRAVAAQRPDVAIAFRTGSPRGAVVRAAGPSAIEGRRFARLATLPFREQAGEGLAAWAATARPGTSGITVELPPRRLRPREASAIAYGLHRLAGTRFANGAREERERMLAFGGDPRDGGGG